MSYTVVCATDFSAAADHALGVAITLAGELNGSVHLVHVFQAPWFTWPEVSIAEKLGITLDDDTSVADWVQQDAKNELQARIDKHADASVPMHAQLVQGESTHKAILDTAAAASANLLVLGNQGRGAATRLLVGSIAERVVRTADLPVLTVPFDG